jgi:hypothetical protein
MEISDLKIEAALSDAMIRSRDIDVLEIDTSVSSGVVTLRGDVHSEQERMAAEQIAKQIEGVNCVINELTVGVMPLDERVRLMSEGLIERLIEEWESREPADPVQGSEYLILALLMISRLRPPEGGGQSRVLIQAAKRRAIHLVAGFCGTSPIIIALELQRLEHTLEAIGAE